MKLPKIKDIATKTPRFLLSKTIKYIVLPIKIITKTACHVIEQAAKYIVLPTITVVVIMSSIDAIFFQYIATEPIIFWLCVDLIAFITLCYCFYENKYQVPSHVIDHRINYKVESAIQVIMRPVNDFMYRGRIHKLRIICTVIVIISSFVSLFFQLSETIFLIQLSVLVTFMILNNISHTENKNQVKLEEKDHRIDRIVDSIAKSITQATKSLVIPTVIILIIAGIVDAIFYQYVIKERTISLAQWISGSGALVGLWLFFRRITNQDKQIDIQINKEIDDRFNAAAELLGNSETSARTAGIYSLYQLAVEPKGEKYRVQAAQILCSHIRSKTQERIYQKQHRERPSNEIQTTINILFKDINGVKGIYRQYFSQSEDFPRADLSHAYLQGAGFYKAHCQRANLSHAYLYGANFEQAQCQGTYFYKAKFQGANFEHVQCQGANFEHAHCQGTNFKQVQCQGANFEQAQCQGALFHDTEFQGAYTEVDNSSTPVSERLKKRIGKDTELKTLQFEGPLDKKTIASIEKVKQDISAEWYEKMKSIIKKHENKEPSYTIPEGIITGVLKDSDELQAIIKQLEAIEKWEKENL